MISKDYWLYILKLEESKYYVGVTSKTPEYRFQQHKNGFAGAAWTKKYKPIKIMDTKFLGNITYEEAEKYENKVVRAYIKVHGLNSVRGGDLRDADDYIQRFGWIYLKDNWEVLTVIILQFLIILYLAIDKYLP